MISEIEGHSKIADQVYKLFKKWPYENEKWIENEIVLNCYFGKDALAGH